MATHFTRQMSNDLMAIFEDYPKHAARQELLYRSLHLNDVFSHEYAKFTIFYETGIV